MISEFFAILGAFFSGLGIVLVGKGLVKSSFLSATMTVTLIGAVVFWVLSLLRLPLNSINSMGILFFVLAGLFVGFAFLTYFKGMEMLGVPTNASVFAAYPLFSSILAIFLLGERPSLGIWVGMVCVICGVVLIERNMHSTTARLGKSKRMALALPLITSLLSGFGYVFRKLGLNAYNEPIVGLAIAYLSSLCLYALLLILSPMMRRSMLLTRHSLQLFWKPALFLCAYQLCTYYALRYGEVSVVAPLTNIEPFFVFILTYLFLKELETITYKLVFGTLIIVAGVSLITIFQ